MGEDVVHLSLFKRLLGEDLGEGERSSCGNHENIPGGKSNLASSLLLFFAFVLKSPSSWNPLRCVPWNTWWPVKTLETESRLLFHETFLHLNNSLTRNWSFSLQDSLLLLHHHRLLLLLFSPVSVVHSILPLLFLPCLIYDFLITVICFMKREKEQDRRLRHWGKEGTCEGR